MSSTALSLNLRVASRRLNRASETKQAVRPRRLSIVAKESVSPTLFGSAKPVLLSTAATHGELRIVARHSVACGAVPNKPVVNALAVPADEEEEKTFMGISHKNLRITLSVCGWFFLNAVFAIYNKKTLNCFPYPWILSWIQIATGAAMMIGLWATKLMPAPKLDLAVCKTLVPTATLHLIAHVSACASYNFSSVSFMQVVKAAEPVCSVIVLTALYGKRFGLLTWLTLIPIVVGVAGGSATEMNFSLIAFAMAMISNVACALRGVTSKSAQEETGLQGINLYAAIAIVSSVLLLPPTLLVEGQYIVAAFQNAGPLMVQHGYGLTASAFLPFLLTGSVFYHLYNQTSYQALAEMNPLSHSVANTVKRVVIILASIAIFKNPITPVGACSAAVAIGGTFLYSLARQHENNAQKEAVAKTTA